MPVEGNHQDLFEDFDIKPSIKISVVIPVKDEETYLQQTLEAFNRQVDVYGKRLSSDHFEILVLANNCTDNSVRIIQDFQKKYDKLNIHLKEVTLPPQQANIGYVRRILMTSAYARLSRIGGGLILTTDADTVVSPDWISQTEIEFKKGVDAVAGRILFSSEEQSKMDSTTIAHHLQDEKYQLLKAELEGKLLNCSHDPLPRHHQHFNGSFAITSECYAKSGGIPDVAYLEDCAFFDRLQCIDAKIRHSPEVKVYTSARCVGRTTIGLSHQLNLWKNSKLSLADIQVESCASIIARCTLKIQLMNLWNQRKNAGTSIAAELVKMGFKQDIITGLTRSLMAASYFGEWFEEAKAQLQENEAALHPPTSLGQAIEELESALRLLG